MNEHIVHQILHAIWPITVCSVTRLLVSISFKQRGSPQTLGCEDQTYEPQKSSQHSVHSPTPSVTGFETPDSPYEAPNGSRRLVLYQSSSSTTVDQIHPVDPGQCTFLGPRVPTTRKRHLLAMASTLSSDGLHPKRSPLHHKKIQEAHQERDTLHHSSGHFALLSFDRKDMRCECAHTVTIQPRPPDWNRSGVCIHTSFLL